MSVALVAVLVLAGLVVFLQFALRPERGADDRATQRLRQLHHLDMVERARLRGLPPPPSGGGRRGTGRRSLRSASAPRPGVALRRLVEPGVTGPGAVPGGVPSAGDPYRRPSPVQQVVDLRSVRGRERDAQGWEQRAPYERRQVQRPVVTGSAPERPPGWAPHELDGVWAPPQRPGGPPR